MNEYMSGYLNIDKNWVSVILFVILLGSIIHEFYQWNKFSTLENSEELLDLAREIAKEEIEKFKTQYNGTGLPFTIKNRPYLIILREDSLFKVFSDEGDRLLFNHSEASISIEWTWGNLSQGGRFYTYGPGQTWILNEDVNSQSEGVTWISDRSLLLQAGPNLDKSPIMINHDYTGLYGIKLDVNKNSQSFVQILENNLITL